jgi:ABC-type antimicrobial peptide transport system permease subunit
VREREFGLLACAGASGRQLSSLVFLECGLYWLLSLPAGLLLGYLLLYSIETPIREGLLLGKVNLYETVLSPAVGVVTGFGAALTLWFSCRKPAKQVRKLRPMSAIRQTAVIQPSRKDADVPTFIQKRWGVVGVLAVQNRRRYRRRVRPAAILLTVCTGLCVSLDGFRLAVRAAGDILTAEASSLLMNFGIGVTALLTLIGGLGLLLLVYGQLTEQKRELCLLRSAGLSLIDLRKLLMGEAALRSIPALLFGIIIGSLLSFLLYQLLQSDFYNFSYILPLAGIGFALMITLLQVIGSAAVAMFEQKRTGIIDGLRQDAA